MVDTVFVDKDTNTPIVAAWLNDVNNQVYGSGNLCVASGTADAIVLTSDSPILSYQVGQSGTFIATNTNTGATTITRDGLTAIGAQWNGVPMVGGEIQSGKAYLFYQDTLTTIQIKPIGSDIFQPSVSGAVATTVQQRLQALQVYAGDAGIYPDGTDYSTEMQALVDYVSSVAGGGTILLETCDDTTPYVMQWEHKSNVVVQSIAMNAPFVGNGAATPGTTIQVPAAGGIIVGQNSAIATYGGALRGIRLYGRGASTTAQGLVLGSAITCQSFLLENCQAENFADEGFVFGEYAFRYRAIHIFAQNCILNTARTQETAVCDFGGNDGSIIHDIESAGPNLSSLVSSNKYIVALRIGGTTNSNGIRVSDIVAEYGERALVLRGADLHLSGTVRAEFAAAENAYIVCSSSTIPIIYTTDGSAAGDGTYDSIIVDAAGQANMFAGAYHTGSNSSINVRYVVNDQTTGSFIDNNTWGFVRATGRFTDIYAPTVYAGAKFSIAEGPLIGLTANSATPDVTGAYKQPNKRFYTQNTVATTLTNITGFQDGTSFTIYCNDDFTTIASGNFSLPAIGYLTLRKGRTYTFISDNGTLRLASDIPPYCYGDIGNAAPNIDVGQYGSSAYLATTTTAALSPSLLTTSAYSGCTFRFWIQSGTTLGGTYTFNGKVLTAGQWVEFTFDGTAWQESAFGSL